MMLSSGGVVSQAVFRNPLADPYIVGINSGAMAGAVLAFILNLPDAFYGIFAFFLAMGTAFLVFFLSGKRGKTDLSMLLIIGIAVSSFIHALTSFCMYAAGQDTYRIIIWTMGYLGTATWNRVIILCVPLALAVHYFFYHRQDIDALQLGDEEAHSLGVNIGTLKRRLLIVVSLVTAFSVAFTGMIGFVGLIVPHAVRTVIGGSHRKLLPVAAFSGGVFLLFADTIARTILSPIEVPIGVVTAFFGAPFFIILAIRTRRRGRI
jgi:iron complex transport system permease protein